MIPTETVRWLRSKDNPAARYLYDRDFREPRLAARTLATRRREMLCWEPVQQLLALQGDDGHFSPTQKSWPKAYSTLTAVVLLARCGMDVSDPPIARALEVLGRHHCTEGGYSTHTGGSGILPCYQGIFARTVATVSDHRNVLLKDPLSWIVDFQRFDHKSTRAGGEGSWPFRTPVSYGCWNSVSCYHGVVGALCALATIPPRSRSKSLRGALRAAIEYLRIHRVYKKSSGDKPLFRYMTQFFIHGGYRYHLLDVLEGLANADRRLARQPWVAQAIETVEALAPDGRIPLVKNYPSKLIDPIPLEQVGEPSRLLTLQWLKVRRSFGL